MLFFPRCEDALLARGCEPVADPYTVWPVKCCCTRMNETPTKAINDLIEALKDGELGFRTAADDAVSEDLKRTFGDYSSQRADFSKTLQALVERAGEEPKENGSLAGTLHRGWINTKVAVTSRSDLSILEECERGEDSAVSTYREILAEPNLGTARDAIENQFSHIQTAHDHIKSLRDALSQRS